MATRKSTTPKTKTTKKRTTKPAAAKARTSKVSTKVTAVKAVAKQAPKVRSSRLAFLTLERIWIAAAVLSLGLAVAAAFLMQPGSYTVTQTHLTSDALLSQNGTAFVSASRAVIDLQLRWMLVALLVVSSVLPILYLTRLKDFYTRQIAKRRVLIPRWIDLAVTSSLMVYIIALLVGYQDMATLKLMGTALVATAGLGWIAEQQNEAARQPIWSAFGLSLFTGAMPWFMIGTAKVSTLLFGDVRSPWYVYALCLTTLAGFILVALNQYNQHRRVGDWKNYAVVERNYALISTVTKLAFAVILIVGLAK